MEAEKTTLLAGDSQTAPPLIKKAFPELRGGNTIFPLIKKEKEI